MNENGSGRNPWKGYVLGVLGSVLGMLMMRLYQQRLGPMLAQTLEGGQSGGGSGGGGNQPGALDSISLVGKHHKEGETSTAAIGRIIYETLTGKEPQSEELKTTLSYLVHWGYGMSQGGMYGALRGTGEGLDLGGGMAYATGMWLFGDEMFLPLVGLQGGPTSASPVTHVNRWGAHLFYGIGTAVGTQTLHKLF